MSRPGPSPLRTGLHLLVSVGIALVFLLLAEGVARLYLVCRRGPHALDQFTAPPPGTPGAPPSVPLAYHYSLKTHTTLDACSGREITFTINSARKRGPEWSPKAAPGALRVMAVGGSTTWGINNPDGATWPALLQADLARQLKRPVEVLNAGVPKQTMAGIMRELPDLIERFHPDAVLYYEAFNDAIYFASDYEQVNVLIGAFHQTWLGSLTRGLHYRSVLYTSLLEKASFRRAREDRHVVPDIRNFEGWIEAFVALGRETGVVPILVLQVTALEPVPGLETVALNDPKAMRAFLLNALEAQEQTPDEEARWRGRDGLDLRTSAPWARRWAYQTQVLVEAARRKGEALGVTVVDPRPVFQAYRGTQPIFCDVIHLTDDGNRILAGVIADEVDRWTIH